MTRNDLREPELLEADGDPVKERERAKHSEVCDRRDDKREEHELAPVASGAQAQPSKSSW
jgi:hypothetical protein